MKNDKKIIVKGNFKTYVNLAKTYKFDLLDGFILTFPIEIDNNPLKQFVLNVENIVKPIYEKDITTKLEHFVNLFSLFFNVACEQIDLEEMIFEDSIIKKGISEQSMCMAGSSVAKDSDVSNFSYIIKSQELNSRNNYCLELYRRSKLMDDFYASYWQIYIILLILLYNPEKNEAERRQIDNQLKNYSPDMRILTNDFDGKNWSLFIAIRDSFTHKAKFSGEDLDLDKELKENIENFIEISRKVILDKLGIDS